MATKQGEKVTKRVQNVAGKQRSREHPYASWTVEGAGRSIRWKYSLIKSQQAHNIGPYCRWLMWVEGYESEYGDTYVIELLPGLLAATDLWVDLTVWPNSGVFLDWAKGEA